MNDIRKEKLRLIDDHVGGAAGWLFALVVAAVLAFGAWYVLAVSGTPVEEDARLGMGHGNAAAQLHLTSTGNSAAD